MVAVLVVLRPSEIILLGVQLVSTEANDVKTAGVPVTDNGSVALETSMFSVCETDCGKDN